MYYLDKWPVCILFQQLVGMLKRLLVLTIVDRLCKNGNETLRIEKDRIVDRTIERT